MLGFLTWLIEKNASLLGHSEYQALRFCFLDLCVAGPGPAPDTQWRLINMWVDNGCESLANIQQVLKTMSFPFSK